MFLIVLILALLSVNSVFSRWVLSATTIPDQILALSPDGSTAIAPTGIYTKSGTKSGTWTLTQPMLFADNSQWYFLNHNIIALFLNNDGSRFAISKNIKACYESSLELTVDIYEALSSEKKVWNVTNSIYGSSLGLESIGCITPAAASADGNSLIVASVASDSAGDENYYYSDIFLLTRNSSSEYILKQQLVELPTGISVGGLSMSADGSILSALLSPNTGEVTTPLYICLQNGDGFYELIEKHSSFKYWNSVTISSNGILMVGTVCGKAQVQFFSRINGHYQLTNVVNIDETFQCSDESWMSWQLCLSSDASILFLMTGSKVYVLQQTTQSSWSVIQTLTDPHPQPDEALYLLISCSSDGSTLLSNSFYDDGNGNPSKYATYIFTAPLPSPRASSTATSSATSSSSASSSATTSSTVSSTLSATATTTAAASSTCSASSTTSQSPSPSPSSSPSHTPSSSPSDIISSSSLSNSLQQPAAITISVLSTALTLVSVAIFVKWFSNYRNQRMLRVDGSISERSEPLLHVN